jgi:predicted Zn-dependent protease with MMP-like domain
VARFAWQSEHRTLVQLVSRLEACGDTLPREPRVTDARRDHETMSEQQHYSEQEFEELVSSALDELTIEFQRALEHVAIVVSDRGAESHAYGMYVGSKLGGIPFFGGGGLPDEILIFRDTLVRDFGDDRERLRLHVTQTVRHEVGHHLGFDETGVPQTRALMLSRPG